jgi:uncharacterized protein
MILYLGTSSLIKFYVEEEYSDIVRRWVREAEIVSTCRVAYAEVISALEIRLKQGDLSKRDYDRIVKRFSLDWPEYASVDFNDREAGRFIRKYGLKRFNAIHLSAAKLMMRGQDGISLTFSSADPSLCNAADSEGLDVLHFC